MENKMYTIILAHYNQMNYIEEALKSIFIQTYNNIELIVVDDYSKTFDKTKVEQLILKHKKNNITSYKVIANPENMGTVKSLNNALKSAKGEYIQFLAADDALYDKNVVFNFVNEFKKNTNTLCVTSQCLMYDNHLEESYGEYVDTKMAKGYNKLTALEQYKKIAFGCIFGSGGTSYRKLVFEKYGYCNEKYKLVEDWAYWLHITKAGCKILFKDFISLKHREGGVSHSLHEEKKQETPPHVKQYYKDILNIMETEIFTNLKVFSFSQRTKLIDQYRDHVRFYSKSLPELETIKNKYIINLIIKNPVYAIEKAIGKVNLKKELIISVILWYYISAITMDSRTINPNTMLIIILYYFLIRFFIKMFFIILRKGLRNE